MEDVQGTRTPGWFRIVAFFALIWSLLGMAMYLMHVGMFGDPTAGLSDAERALADSTPAWVTAAFGTATVTALLGAIGLVLGRKWAQPLLIGSALAVAVQEAWIVFVSDAIAVHGTTGWLVPFIIFDIAVLLAWLAGVGVRNGWLR
jgi:hypothetical protein